MYSHLIMLLHHLQKIIMKSYWDNRTNKCRNMTLMDVYVYIIRSNMCYIFRWLSLRLLQIWHHWPHITAILQWFKMEYLWWFCVVCWCYEYHSIPCIMHHIFVLMNPIWINHPLHLQCYNQCWSDRYPLHHYSIQYPQT